ncbi:superinfection immunity protein [Herbaspirillum robiniae]|uniref:superinfection immunity protein n=1 Tax=Herbaspirillum robiniae TaxID=2014887 RepID=UPI0009A18125|nr:superinfection immunity protein [Herbaspirillum robiniae]
MGQYSELNLNEFGRFVAGSFFVVAPLLYFLPTFEAWLRNHPKLVAIAILNLLLGWTLLGWIAAYVWTFTHTPKKGENRSVLDTAKDASREAMAFYGTGYVSRQPNDHSEQSDPETKMCPYCAEEVRYQAIKCKHCQSDLSGTAT